VNCSSDVAFSPTVKAVQERKGSRRNYQRMEESGSWQTCITPDLRAFIEAQTSIFLATANSQGQPYIQHRGGPRGFLTVLDDHTLGFVDFVGNRQYITVGNLAENPRAHLFLIDYAHRKRVKIWGEARVTENEPELIERLMPKDYKARASQIILFKVSAWDANCPRHIPQRVEAVDVLAAIGERDRKIAALQAQLAQLRASAPRRGSAQRTRTPRSRTTRARCR
jgi:predicted pyridoxine 5'-phosphate oxidase superfamily flavin-nucleotide-binding protein